MLSPALLNLVFHEKLVLKHLVFGLEVLTVVYQMWLTHKNCFFRRQQRLDSNISPMHSCQWPHKWEMCGFLSWWVHIHVERRSANTMGNEGVRELRWWSLILKMRTTDSEHSLTRNTTLPRPLILTFINALVSSWSMGITRRDIGLETYSLHICIKQLRLPTLKYPKDDGCITCGYLIPVAAMPPWRMTLYKMNVKLGGRQINVGHNMKWGNVLNWTGWKYSCKRDQNGVERTWGVNCRKTGGWIHQTLGYEQDPNTCWLRKRTPLCFCQHGHE